MWFLLTALFGLGVAATAANDVPAHDDVRKLTAIATEYQGRLGISEPISILIVPANKRLVSVRRSPDAAKTFVVEFDQNFLATLTEEDQRAVLAHELGHVWIFTHHPYLQTEALANEKALQLVSAGSLRQVYEKVWRREGEKGTLQEFLGKVQ